MFGELMRLTKDVEVKKVKVKNEERSVVNNRVAISDGGDHTTYIDVTVWGGLADLFGMYLKKGSEFYAEGTLKNKEIKIGEKSIQSVYLSLEKIKFTYGNKKEAAKEDVQ